MKKKTVMAMLIMSMMLPGTAASAEQPGDLICVQSGEVSGITESAGEESADEYFIPGEESSILQN